MSDSREGQCVATYQGYQCILEEGHDGGDPDATIVHTDGKARWVDSASDSNREEVF